jgi:hypothetical protein
MFCGSSIFYYNLFYIELLVEICELSFIYNCKLFWLFFLLFNRNLVYMGNSSAIHESATHNSNQLARKPKIPNCAFKHTEPDRKGYIEPINNE